MTKKNTNIFHDIDIRKLKLFTTPVGIAVSAFITAPSTDYDEDGQYFVKLKLPTKDKSTQQLIKLIDTAAEDAYNSALELLETPAERKKCRQSDVSYKPEEDDDGNETGFTLFNFKRKAIRRDKNGNIKPVKIRLFDSVGQPVDPEGLDVWGGSELAISFRLVPFYTAGVGAGVSHRIEAIQLIKVVSGGDDRTAEDFGFKKQTGGFVGGKSDEDEADDTIEDEVSSVDDEKGDY